MAILDIQLKKDLQRELVKHIGSGELEFEIRFGSVQGTRFIPGLTRQHFVRLQQTATKLDPGFVQSLSRDHYFDKSKTRYTQDYTLKGDLIKEFWLAKRSVYQHDLPEYGLRFAMSTEIPLNDARPNLSSATLIRQKHRWSFTIKNSFRLDMTEIHTLTDEQLSSVVNLQTGMTTLNLNQGWSFHNLYEIELEILNPEKVNFDVLNSVLYSILQETQNTFLVYPQSEKINIFSQIAKILPSQRRIYPGTMDFSNLTQSRNLKIRDMFMGGLIPTPKSKVVNVSYPVNDGVYYTATLKADGQRKLLYFHPQGLYFLMALDQMMKIAPSSTAQKYPQLYGTLVEGELIPKSSLLPNADPEIVDSKFVFLMYDCLSVSGDNSIRGKPHLERLSYLDDVQKQVKIKGLFLQVKEFYSFRSAGEFFKIVNYLLDIQPSETPIIPESNTSVDEAQQLAEKMERLTTDDNITDTRLAQPNRQISKLWYTIDGLIFTPSSSYDPSVQNVDLSKRKLDAYPDIMKWKPMDMLTIDFRIRHIIDQDGNNQVELLVGKDVSFVNSTNKQFTLDMVDVSPQLLATPSGSVVEFQWLNGKFVYHRLREDKPYPNSEAIALDNWNILHQPLTEKVIRGQEFSLVFRYHNRIKSDLYAYGGKQGGKTLVCIGSGRGGDIFKWVEYGYTKVLCVEPDPDNVAELQRRLSKSSLEYRIVQTRGQDIQRIYDEIVSFFGGSPVDALVYMLSLSFFFDTPQSTQSVIRLAQSVVAPGGYFMALTIDGQAVEKFFQPENLGKLYNQRGSEKVANFKQINLSYSPPTVKIHIPGSIVENQTEYLVDIPCLIQCLTEVGYTLIAQGVADKETFLNKEELYYTRLYSWLVLRKN